MKLHLCEERDICNVRSQPQRTEPKKNHMKNRQDSQWSVCNWGRREREDKKRSQKYTFKQ